ncbi:hypothetical protein BASA81_002620 [Batrachochytrium salamandrivorans]|nr:hypothetical protein BASA81_002620 [Batrachochytrium salamandrivorans]
MWLLLGLLAAAVTATTPGLTLMEKDMLCLNRQFKDPSFPQSPDGGDKDEFCEGFSTRWGSMFPGVELGVGVGGLRALAFKSLSNANQVAFAFREFLHDKPHFGLDDDYWQVYSMTQKDGLSFANEAVMYFRYYFGLDYLRHATLFVDEVLKRGGGGRLPMFTGYGFGGSIAMLQALRLESAFAVTFSSPSNVGEVAVKFWNAKPSSKRITNLLLAHDETGQFGTAKSAKECRFPTSATYRLMFDDNKGNVTSRNVFSDFGFAAVTAGRSCKDPIVT